MTATAIAFRANYKDVNWSLPVSARRIPTTWPPHVRWWLMAKRLEAVERCGTYALRCRFLTDCVEWRVADLPEEKSTSA